jgi:hypothetical protein
MVVDESTEQLQEQAFFANGDNLSPGQLRRPGRLRFVRSKARRLVTLFLLVLFRRAYSIRSMLAHSIVSVQDMYGRIYITSVVLCLSERACRKLL